MFGAGRFSCPARFGHLYNGGMAAIREQDISEGMRAFDAWRDAAAPHRGEDLQTRLAFSPTELPRPTWAMAVRYSLYLLENKAPGPGVEVRVAPWSAVKILDGPASDPHNLTPPDVIELEPEVWLRVASGLTTWGEEKSAGHITAIGERDDLSALLPLE
jgi:hypothetical protein